LEIGHRAHLGADPIVAAGIVDINRTLTRPTPTTADQPFGRFISLKAVMSAAREACAVPLIAEDRLAAPARSLRSAQCFPNEAQARDPPAERPPAICFERQRDTFARPILPPWRFAQRCTLLSVELK
jgi:hypothetical protein